VLGAIAQFEKASTVVPVRPYNCAPAVVVRAADQHHFRANGLAQGDGAFGLVVLKVDDFARHVPVPGRKQRICVTPLASM
jgi:hypothetical protein